VVEVVAYQNRLNADEQVFTGRSSKTTPNAPVVARAWSARPNTSLRWLIRQLSLVNPKSSLQDDADWSCAILRVYAWQNSELLIGWPPASTKREIGPPNGPLPSPIF
jgi:hypothetical protein